MEIKLHSTPEMAERFDALYQWLNRRYQLKQSQFNFKKHTLKFFKIADVDRVLDDVVVSAANSDDETPYWAELWPSAVALGQFIFDKLTFKSETVLDLGCGLGFTGLAAGLKGAQPVFSDFREDALRMAELNWMLNFSEPANFWLMDWRDPKISQKMDVVIASDVAYERRWFWPLLDTFRAVLKPAGVIYLSEPNRPIAREFFDLLKQEKFILRKIEEKTNIPRTPGKITIYKIFPPREN